MISRTRCLVLLALGITSLTANGSGPASDAIPSATPAGNDPADPPDYLLPDLPPDTLVHDGARFWLKPIVAVVADYTFFEQDDPSRPYHRDGQTRQADNVIQRVGEHVQSLPGFRGARAFISEDGNELVTLTEWRARESFQRFGETEFGRAALELLSELQPKSYRLRQHAAVEGQ